MINFKLLFLLLINPLLSFIYFLSLDNKKRVLYLSLLMAVVSMYIIPTKSYDIVRHYFMFETLNMNTSLIKVLEKERDFLIKLISYIYRYLGLKKELLPFSFVLITYLFNLKTIEKILKVKNIRNKEKVQIFIYYYLFIDFFSAFLGLRNIAAISIFLNILYDSKFKFNKMLFSNITHIMTIVYSCICIFMDTFEKLIIRIKINKLKIIFLLSFLIFIFPEIFKSINNLIVFLPEHLTKHLQNYTEGYWAGKYLEDLGIKGIIFNKISSLAKYWIIIFLLTYNFSNITYAQKKRVIFLFVSFIFSNLISFNVNMYGRYTSFPIYLGVLVFLELYKTNRNNLKSDQIHIRIFKIITIILFCSRVYTLRDSLLKSVENLLYPTLYELFFLNINYINFL